MFLPKGNALHSEVRYFMWNAQSTYYLVENKVFIFQTFVLYEMLFIKSNGTVPDTLALDDGGEATGL